MDDTQLKYLDYIVRQNNAMIEQLNALTKVIANHLNLPIEEEVDDKEETVDDQIKAQLIEE